MTPAAFLFASAMSLVAASALAADLPSLKAPPAAPRPPQLWSGFYAGLNAGGVFQHDNAVNFTAEPSGTAPYFVNATPAQMALRAPFWATQNGVISGAGSGGFIGGVQLGYNWRMDNLGGVVAGVEGDIQGLAARRSASNLTGGLYNNILAPGDSLLNAAGGRPSSAQYLATLRGRIGYLVTPTLLAYATGGFAFGGVNFSATTSSLYTNAAGVQAQNAIGYTNFFNTQPGWAVGGGVEWMFMPHWSLKAEYLHFSLGGANIATSISAYPIGIANALGGTGGLPADWTMTKFSSRVSGDIGRVGVNYHFYSDAAPTALASASGAGGKESAGGKEGQAKSRPRAGIPAGVYGAVMSPAGELRLIYHASYMENLGNYVGASTISPAAIVTTIPYFPLSIYDNRAGDVPVNVEKGGAALLALSR